MTVITKDIGDAELPSLQIGNAASGNIKIVEDTTTPTLVFDVNATSGIVLRQDQYGNSFVDTSQSLFFRRLSGASTMLMLHQQGWLRLYDVTGTPAAETGAAHIFSDNGEMKVTDANGNTTTISPHSFDNIALHPDDRLPVVLRHSNHFIGREQVLYLSRMAQLLETLFPGENLLYEFPVVQLSWADVQAQKAAQRQNEIAVYDARLADAMLLPEPKRSLHLSFLGDRPAPYAAQPEPIWMTPRKRIR